MKIYLATWLEDNQGLTLTEQGSNRRLLSYYFLKDAPADFMEKYSQTGRYGKGAVWNGRIKEKRNEDQKG